MRSEARPGMCHDEDDAESNKINDPVSDSSDSKPDLKKSESNSPDTAKTTNQNISSGKSKTTESKLNGTPKTADNKTNGTPEPKTFLTKRDLSHLTAPTKSSAAKAKQQVTPAKGDNSSVKSESKPIIKGEVKKSSAGKCPDAKSNAVKSTKGDNSGQIEEKDKSTEEKDTKEDILKDKSLKTKENKKDTPQDQSSGPKEEKGQIPNNKKEEHTNKSGKDKSEKKVNGLPPNKDSEKVYAHPTPSAPPAYSPIIKRNKPTGIVTMASYDPQSVDEAELDATIIPVSEGEVKYMNNNYKKVAGRIYDHNCDVKLVVKDANFRAHRDVLSEASDYFSAMFSHNMKEKDQFTIELKEISPKGFTAMLDYFYHGNITITTTTIEDILEAARFFHVDWILESACHFLIHNMSLENYTTVMTLTDKYWLGDLRWDIFKYLAQNLVKLEKKDGFYSKITFELLLQFLMENIYLDVSEYFLLNMILKWVKADPKNREEHKLSLLRQIKFPIMENEELESISKEVLAIPEMNEVVQQALSYSCCVWDQCTKVGEQYFPRGSQPLITILSFCSEGSYLFYRNPCKPGLIVEELGPCGFETADYQAMAQTRCGNFLYAAGGYDKHFASSENVFRFDPRFREWMGVSHMNIPRVSFALCSSKTKLFAVAGIHRIFSELDESPETILDSVEAYDPLENTWHLLAPLPKKCFECAATVNNNSLYVSGGISGDHNDPCPLDNMWCLNLENMCEGWVSKPNMMSKRQAHSLTSVGGKIYAMGGYTMSNGAGGFGECCENEVFDIETNQWTAIAPTPPEFGHLFRSCDVFENVIFFLGGNTCNAMLFMYDMAENSWDEIEAVGPNVQKLAMLEVALPQ